MDQLINFWAMPQGLRLDALRAADLLVSLLIFLLVTLLTLASLSFFMLTTIFDVVLLVVVYIFPVSVVLLEVLVAWSRSSTRRLCFSIVRFFFLSYRHPSNSNLARYTTSSPT